MMRETVTRAVLVMLAAGLFVGLARAEDRPIPDRDLAAWLEKRLGEWQPAAEEKRFDEIGWARDIREALRLGKEHHRPIFLFTHDGHMNVGRC